MTLEYGRKILPHLFKRNNYHTMVVGKPQPVEEKLDFKEHFFVEGTRFWGYDQENWKKYETIYFKIEILRYFFAFNNLLE